VCISVCQSSVKIAFRYALKEAWLVLLPSKHTK